MFIESCFLEINNGYIKDYDITVNNIECNVKFGEPRISSPSVLVIFK